MSDDEIESTAELLAETTGLDITTLDRADGLDHALILAAELLAEHRLGGYDRGCVQVEQHIDVLTTYREDVLDARRKQTTKEST
ncbi:hypothetical protein [Actinoalloteichus sp. GBA129-24]|uniref:hypothetical protein n=1 Tax=Actinoalloteichus sp. GBA129-24 TaxID=1612551 RepID=UPI0009506ABF|nr:hypothetical protein [Actinoalloteichus sp. GBA129-24]APU20911.1 hypothetical protein UA75_14505 [Actinoalloteichus sp. GBA129-24]APU24160.1 hypothetical protein UA75_30985 [Actinoalloteichus sp. GBA129-24]